MTLHEQSFLLALVYRRGCIDARVENEEPRHLHLHHSKGQMRTR